MQDHCAEINRCNQRGGRMLSVVDLIEAGTITPEAAAYSLAAIGNGASFMVGARPGGAGKTTVMGALLNFVPPAVQLRPAATATSIERGLKSPAPRCCFVCHEIGDGPYYAYLWGSELRLYFELPTAGHMMATNLHADTYEEARDQVCDDNGVTPLDFRQMNLLFFLEVSKGLGARTRRICSIWESDGMTEHRQVFDGDPGTLTDSSLVSRDSFASAMSTVEEITASGARSIEEVRGAVVDSFA